MKRKLLIWIFVFFTAAAGMAQDVTTMWPYMYPEFKTGTVYFTNRQTLSAQVNVHLLKSSLHYLDHDKIKEAVTSDIVLVLVDEDKFYMRDNQLMRVVNGDSTGFVAELVIADISAVMESGGAYGSSSNVQATRKLSSLEIGGININNHMELKSKKLEGSLLPLIKKFYIVTADHVFPANRKAIEAELPEHKKAAFNKFVKKNKINWKRPASLALLPGFLKD